MKINSIATDGQGLVEDTLYQCGLPTVTASYASYALVDIIRNINNAYLEEEPKIWSAAFGWRFSDSNATQIPYAYGDLSNAVDSVLIPSTARTIRGAAVRTGASTYKDLTQIGEEDFLGGTGTPTGYCPIGNVIRLDPAPTSGSVTLSAGIRIETDKDVTLFTTASTTAEPGFASSFHRVLSLGAAIDFVQDKPTQDRLVAMKARIEKDMVSFYAHRNVDRPIRMRVIRNINRYK